jgi:hypothetical protein
MRLSCLSHPLPPTNPQTVTRPPPLQTRDVPILIDEHYNARALEDMIIVAENAANQVGWWCWRDLVVEWLVVQRFCGLTRREARRRQGPITHSNSNSNSNHHHPKQDEHPTGFMCDGGLLSRPLSPMRHALTATLQHLGGVLPPHLGYHPQ